MQMRTVIEDQMRQRRSDPPGSAMVSSNTPTETPSQFPTDKLSPSPTLISSMHRRNGPTGLAARAPTGSPLLAPVPAYDPSVYPTFKEPTATGAVGNWKRLPMPSIQLGPDGPADWWPQRQSPIYLNHNLLTETEANDPSFNRAAIQTESMRVWMYKLTNQQRREAVISCAVAFERFMQAHFPDAEWWLEGGSLIGARRAPHKFVPWDNDADVTMVEDSWQSVASLLMQEAHANPQPNAEGARCGCLLVDTASFGSRRAGFTNLNQIPGRVINECTGNYVDIFGARRYGMGTLVLSQQPDYSDESQAKWKTDRSVVLPPKPCKLEGYPFKCPAKGWRYLDSYGYDPPPTQADHVWDPKRKVYEPKLDL
jgi:hypothetical protein